MFLVNGILFLLISTVLVSSLQPKNNAPIITTSSIGSTENPSIVEQTIDETASFQPLIGDLDGDRKGSFNVTADAALGEWNAFVDYQPTSWNPGARVRVSINLSFQKKIVNALKKKYPVIDKACILITAERDFDPEGYQHVPWDCGVSTLLATTGLPIEGGGMTTLSRFTGSTQRTPVDIMLEVPISAFDTEDRASGWYKEIISCSFDLPKDLPSGLYRLRLDFGLKLERNLYTYFGFESEQYWYNFNGDGIGYRSWDQNISCLYSPPIAASGLDVAGKMINGSQIKRKCYFALLWDYDSNGYKGVVAQEDQDKVAISPRNIIHDEVVLPRFAPEGWAYDYSLEPHILLDDIDPQRNIPWRYDKGEWSVNVTLPNGSSINLWSQKVTVPIPNGTRLNLGTSKFVTKNWIGPSTNNSILTSWVPPAYGKYTVEAKGWIEDIWGNRYYGGGNYSFWIANRLTIATATFQGQPYNVGNRYGRDIAFSPPVPADVTVKANLYVNSDPENVRTVISTGKATPGGVFGAAQGMKYLPLDSAGEYQGEITATYWDHEGNLWAGVMRHAGVVYPENSSIIAHGKKLDIQGGLVDRGEQHFEGYYYGNGSIKLDHMNYPYNSGDALLIASEEQSANKIVPVLTYEEKDSNATYDQSLQDIGRSNIQIKTSNDLSPDMFPEYITDMAYYYASAPRPGFMSRFIVGQGNVFAPYWSISPNNFGGQYGASNNGDMPGDIYRLLGCVVLKPRNSTPEYAGYQASAFILPNGSNNNRIIAPGDEDLPSPDGKPARFFLVPTRPGMVYQVGTNFTAVLQIDPVVSCTVRYILTAPDGSKRIAEGIGDKFGYFTSKDKWTLDQPGVWNYTINATWNGYKGRVPGLPDEGGYIFVLENGDPGGPGMTLNLSGEQTFSPTSGLEIHGNSSASQVYFAAITPGAVLDQGIIPVSEGKFIYKFDPNKMADKIKTYDIINLENGKPEIGRIVHLTFFSEEKGTNGPYHSFVRVIFRGTTAIYVKDR